MKSRLFFISFEWYERKSRFHFILSKGSFYIISFFRIELGNLMKFQLHDIEIFDQISPHTNLYDEFLIFSYLELKCIILKHLTWSNKKILVNKKLWISALIWCFDQKIWSNIAPDYIKCNCAFRGFKFWCSRKNSY